MNYIIKFNKKNILIKLLNFYNIFLYVTSFINIKNSILNYIKKENKRKNGEAIKKQLSRNNKRSKSLRHKQNVLTKQANEREGKT